MTRQHPIKPQFDREWDNFSPKIKSMNFVYKVENTHDKKLPEMTVILTEYVEGVGDVGDVVTVKSYIARNELLLPRLAVYDTPENRHKYSNMVLDRPRRTPFALKTLAQLEDQILYIPMKTKKGSVVSKDHVRIAFRLAGVELGNDCLELPEEPILSDVEDLFDVKVVINGLFPASVTCKIYQYQLDLSGRPIPPAQVSKS